MQIRKQMKIKTFRMQLASWHSNTVEIEWFDRKFNDQSGQIRPRYMRSNCYSNELIRLIDFRPMMKVLTLMSWFCGPHCANTMRSRENENQARIWARSVIATLEMMYWQTNTIRFDWRRANTIERTNEIEMNEIRKKKRNERGGKKRKWNRIVSAERRMQHLNCIARGILFDSPT